MHIVDASCVDIVWCHILSLDFDHSISYKHPYAKGWENSMSKLLKYWVNILRQWSNVRNWYVWNTTYHIIPYTEGPYSVRMQTASIIHVTWLKSFVSEHNKSPRRAWIMSHESCAAEKVKLCVGHYLFLEIWIWKSASQSNPDDRQREGRGVGVCDIIIWVVGTVSNIRFLGKCHSEDLIEFISGSAFRPIPKHEGEDEPKELIDIVADHAA